MLVLCDDVTSAVLPGPRYGIKGNGANNGDLTVCDVLYETVRDQIQIQKKKNPRKQGSRKPKCFVFVYVLQLAINDSDITMDSYLQFHADTTASTSCLRLGRHTVLLRYNPITFLFLVN